MLAVGACVVGSMDQTFYAELKPLDGNFVKEALAVSGFSLTKLNAEGEEPARAMGRFEQWIKEVSDEPRPVFVAFNAPFDWSFTHWYFIKFLGHDPFGISGLDIKAYFMGKHGVSWNKTVKKNVTALYPTQSPHTHNALDDAKEQAEIFEKMLKNRNFSDSR